MRIQHLIHNILHPNPENPSQMAAINDRLARLEAELKKATDGYRLLLIEKNPDILPELINGESIAALEDSTTTARELTARIRRQIEKQLAAERIPGGAPARTPPNLENLNAHEKIVYGLEKE